MKDFPTFTTEHGVAGLILREIPYRKTAYVRIHASEQPEELLQECISFCRICGAEAVYATGHDALERYPLHTAVWRMCGALGDEEPKAALWPVQPENADEWRELYNRYMADVPNAAYMTKQDVNEMLQKGDGYFVHKNGELLGIGRAGGDTIDAIVSVKPGAGEVIFKTLCTLLAGEQVQLEVASVNERAIRLYRRCGLIPTAEISKWYKII